MLVGCNPIRVPLALSPKCLPNVFKPEMRALFPLRRLNCLVNAFNAGTTYSGSSFSNAPRDSCIWLLVSMKLSQADLISLESSAWAATVVPGCSSTTSTMSLKTIGWGMATGALLSSYRGFHQLLSGALPEARKYNFAFSSGDVGLKLMFEILKYSLTAPWCLHGAPHSPTKHEQTPRDMSTMY